MAILVLETALLEAIAAELFFTCWFSYCMFDELLLPLTLKLITVLPTWTALLY